MMTRFALSHRQHRRRGEKRPSGFFKRSAGLLLLCGLSLLLLLSACTNPFYTPTQSGSSVTQTPATPTSTVSSPTPSPTPRTITTYINSNCPSYVASTKWDNVLATKQAVNKVQLVNCGSLEGAGSLEAVVGVGYYTPDARLDVYVFDHLTTNPFITFKILGLLDGDAQVSQTGTLMTAEIGPHSILSKHTDLFKEYQWINATFTQVLFPYFYPDMTHYQAEQDNTVFTAEVAAGQKADLWKTSGTAEADHLAVSLFHWSSTTDTVLKFQPTVDTIIVQVTNTGQGGGGFVATMHHLDGNIKNILEITTVMPLDTNTSITSPAVGAQLTSPVSVSGVAPVGSSILGEVVFYDDTYVLVGNSGPIPSQGSGYVNFTNLVKYTLNAPGSQEGVVVLMTTTLGNLALTSQIEMVKVFFTA
jgi:hypothetical protein